MKNRYTYTVAVAKRHGEAVASWRGPRQRDLPGSFVQYTVRQVRNQAHAEHRAETIHTLLRLRKLLSRSSR